MKGDYTAGKTVYCRFNTHKADGTPITLAGTPVVSAYKASTTESAAGITLTVDYDGRTGLHSVTVDTSADGTFYAAGNDFDLVITAGTVDSVSVVGTVVGSFSLANRSFLRPTAADRTLDVSSGGEAGLDWANVGSPTATQNLSGTTIASLTNAPTAGDLTATMKTSVTIAATAATPTSASVTGDVGGNVVGSVASVTNGVTLAASQHVIVDSGTVTDLTNLPDAPTDWLAAVAVKADAVAKIQSGLATSSGLSSLQSHGDSAWATATGFSTLTTSDIPTAAAIASAVGSQVTGDHGSGAWTTATGFSTFDPAADTVAHVALVDTTTTNTDMRGTDSAALAATALSTATWTGTKAGYLDAAISSVGGGVDVSADVAAIKAKTDSLTFTTPGKVDASADVALSSDDIDAIASGVSDVIGADIEAIRAKTDALGNGAVSIVSPNAPDGKTIMVTAGDDYFAADRVVPTWSATWWPSLAGATVTFTVAGTTGPVQVAASVLGTGDEATKTVRIELTAAQTILMTSSYYNVVAILANGHEATLVGNAMLIVNHH